MCIRLEHVFVLRRCGGTLSCSVEASAGPTVRLYSTRTKQLLMLPSAARAGDEWGGAWGRRWIHSSSRTNHCGRWTHYSSVTWRAYLRPEGSIVVCGRTPQGFMSHEFPLWPGQMVTIVLAVACVQL